MFSYKTEKDLKGFVIENFSHFFEFDFLGEERQLNSGCSKRIDLLGADKDSVYIIELKRNIARQSTVKQLDTYLKNFDSSKNRIGIILAPKFAKNIDLTGYENIRLQQIDNAQYINEHTLNIIISDEQYEALRKLSYETRKSISQIIRELLDKELEK